MVVVPPLARVLGCGARGSYLAQARQQWSRKQDALAARATAKELGRGGTEHRPYRVLMVLSGDITLPCSREVVAMLFDRR